MKLIYCDRCGAEGKPKHVAGPRVVTVTLDPMSRRLDLCGTCRNTLNDRLDEFVEEIPAARSWDETLERG